MNIIQAILGTVLGLILGISAIKNAEASQYCVMYGSQMICTDTDYGDVGEGGSDGPSTYCNQYGSQIICN